jgi:hypothetical protein
MNEPLTTMNLFGVGARLDSADVIIGVPVASRLTRDEALNLAAWLVAVTDTDGRFDDLLARVRNT